jgi:UDP-2-acetamido-2,6-beta-L-arabino-hexul-4-ose reductase
MDSRVTIERLTFPTDARGLVLEPIGPDDLPHQRNVHVVVTLPGHVRGNHYHRLGREIAVVFGPALFRYRDGREVRDLDIAEGEAYRVTIPVGVAHAIKNTGSLPATSVAFNTVAHDPANPDVVRDVLIEP